MSQPPKYNRQASFANLQALNPSGQPPGNTMDAEYNAIKTTLDATLADLALIQNDDGTVANASIGPAQLSPQLVLGFNPPMAWVTAHAYTASPASTVLQGTGMYLCLVGHTSAVFASDLAAGKWLLIFDLSALTFGNASQIAVSAHGTNVTANVQTSLNNLEDNKAALSHTHTASQISDATAAGRNMLTAANVAAQQVLLGLGSLAFLNSITVTNIPAQLTFTGRINSGTLSSDQNDFTPTAWASNAVLQLHSSTNVVITGLGATTDGDVKYLQNVGAFNITFIGNSASSAAANRISLLSPMVIRAGQAAAFQYDAANTAWRVLTLPVVYAPLGSFKNLRVGNVANYLGDAAPSAPNTQVSIFAEELTLEDTFTSTWKVGVAVTADGAVVGANGIDAGALGASAWYSVWVIGNPNTNTVAGLLSTSATAPTLPSGYGFKARVGWMRTDGSSHFLKILQYGRRARYSGTFPTITSGNNAGADVSVVNFVPSTAPVIALFAFGAIPTGTTIAASPTATASPGAPVQIGNASGSTEAANSAVTELHLEATTVHYASTAGAGPGIACYGWEDTL